MEAPLVRQAVRKLLNVGRQKFHAQSRASVNHGAMRSGKTAPGEVRKGCLEVPGLF